MYTLQINLNNGVSHSTTHLTTRTTGNVLSIAFLPISSLFHVTYKGHSYWHFPILWTAFISSSEERADNWKYKVSNDCKQYPTHLEFFIQHGFRSNHSTNTALHSRTHNHISTGHEQSIWHSQHTHTHILTTPNKHPTHNYQIHR